MGNMAGLIVICLLCVAVTFLAHKGAFGVAFLGNVKYNYKSRRSEYKQIVSEFRSIAEKQIANINLMRVNCIQDLSLNNPNWQALTKFERDFDYPIPANVPKRIEEEILKIREGVIREKNNALLEINAIRGLEFK